MDSKRFSEITKALASGQSRRGVVKGLAAGLAGGILSLRDRGQTEARTKSGPGRICREDANCAEGTFCLYDNQSRRRKCTCYSPVCLEYCTYECTDINFSFNSSENCEEQCRYECIDRNCSYYFNQQLPI